MHYQRYVAIGDSSTEGLDDPDGQGGYRGWANRLAENVAASQGSLLYANLGIRGRRTHEILDEQLPAALAMKPDLMTLFSGTNDVVRRGFDLDQVAGDIERMHREIIGTGAVLLTFTLPDLTPVMPMGRLVSAKLHDFNDALRSIAACSGARLVDFAEHPVATDPRLWSEDRLHANSAGHARIASALAHALEVPGTDGSWAEPLPEIPRRSLIRSLGAEVDWLVRFFIPWVWRHSLGRSSGDGVTAKRPDLEPVLLAREES
jgi:lysophospholipase L1-like esterase